jgi:hypothetical protein
MANKRNKGESKREFKARSTGGKLDYKSGKISYAPKVITKKTISAPKKIVDAKDISSTPVASKEVTVPTNAVENQFYAVNDQNRFAPKFNKFELGKPEEKKKKRAGMIVKGIENQDYSSTNENKFGNLR